MGVLSPPTPPHPPKYYPPVRNIRGGIPVCRCAERSRLMEQGSEPTKRAAWFIRRDVAKRANGDRTSTQRTVAGCTAATSVWRAISDQIKSARKRQTHSRSALRLTVDCCLARLAVGFVDGSSHFPIPGGPEFNHTRAPAEAIHARS